ncbi:MAG TPA: large conductance mechanosensitive channel protein MscL [Polyangiaceae bacterium]|jgi:large conductance mechanosensitive channel
MSTAARRPPLFRKAEAETQSFWAQFKGFALKGNVVDLAVAVVIGGAFGKIISALVADFVMPIVTLVLPSGDWRTSGVILRHAADPKNDVMLRWGDLLGAVLDFGIIALVLFVVVSKLLHARQKPAQPTTKACPFCLETIPKAATRCRACTSELVMDVRVP